MKAFCIAIALMVPAVGNSSSGSGFFILFTMGVVMAVVIGQEWRVHQLEKRVDALCQSLLCLKGLMDELAEAHEKALCQLEKELTQLKKNGFFENPN
ncbi:MAG: hypothetical protein HY559_01605 [Gammaproteobacteria bacterium]|nr:hypothetical protein [Gammaproteobacteria bacterium]